MAGKQTQRDRFGAMLPCVVLGFCCFYYYCLFSRLCIFLGVLMQIRLFQPFYHRFFSSFFVKLVPHKKNKQILKNVFERLFYEILVQLERKEAHLSRLEQVSKEMITDYWMVFVRTHKIKRLLSFLRSANNGKFSHWRIQIISNY